MYERCMNVLSITLLRWKMEGAGERHAGEGIEGRIVYMCGFKEGMPLLHSTAK